MTIQHTAIAALVGILLATGGCCPKPETVQTLPQLITAHNDNANDIQKLWSRAKVEVTLRNADGLQVTWGSVSPAAHPNALLILEKTPIGTDFVLIGREMAGIELFRLGQSHTEGAYYFWYNFGGQAAAYYGQTALAGAPGIDDMPLNPNDLLSVLAIEPLPTDLTQLPAVTMRLEEGHESYAYVLSHVTNQPVSRQILATRETRLRWSDTEPADPTGIRFFRPSGATFMDAQLSNMSEVITDSDAAPQMPTTMDLTWPDTKSGVTRLRIVLSEMSTTKEFDSRVFQFAPNAPSLAPDQLFQVDRHLTTKDLTR
jgi:hypothetical protein